MISSCHCEYTHKKPPIKCFCQNTQPESDEVSGISDYRKYMKRRMFLNDRMRVESEKSRRITCFFDKEILKKKKRKKERRVEEPIG